MLRSTNVHTTLLMVAMLLTAACSQSTPRGGMGMGGASGASPGSSAGAGADGGPLGGADGMSWVGTWSAAPQLTEPGNLPPEPGLSQNTLRQLIYVSIGGSQLRARFSNEYGNAPLTMNGVQLALSTNGQIIDTATARPLAFAGMGAVTIPAGGTVTSDPLDFPLSPQAKVAVTIAFGSTPSNVTGHPGSRTASFIVPGDAVGAESLAASVRTEHWYYLTGLDVLAGSTSRAVVTLGDSITDGRGSTTDGNNRWPDNLSRRLRENPATAEVAVLNQGIGGNAVLSGGLGPTAVSRFQRDVLDQSGVRWVIVLHGVNDIGSAASEAVAQNLIGAYEQLIAAARAQGVGVYGVPILPFAGSQYDTPTHEAARQTVNAWIRAPGNFDAVIDLDAAVQDPANPAALLPAYDSGDHLHLSPAGYQRMADAIDLALFSQ